MVYLLGSVILTCCFIVLLKYSNNKGINNFEIITFNYWVCVIVGSFVNGHYPIQLNNSFPSWAYWAIVVGIFFIITFNLIAFTTQKIGISVASVTHKLSLIIPFIFSIYLYHDQAGILKWVGLVTGLVAVLFACFSTKNDNASLSSLLRYIILLALFIMSGLSDTLVKYVEKNYLDNTNNNAFLATSFSVAALIGTIGLLYRYLILKKNVQWRAVLAGIGVGIINYFSIWCLIKALQQYTNNSTTIIPVNNMGIVVLNTIAGAILFKEKLSIANWIGILLSLVAIAFIAYG